MTKTKWYAKPIRRCELKLRAKRRGSVAILVALALVLSLGIVAVPKTALAGELHVGPGQTYTTIQSAVDAASDDDTIIVAAGTYNEEINITTSNISLLGEDRETTTIDAGGVRWGAIDVTNASHIVISGFTLRNSGVLSQDKGINIIGTSQYITVQDCKIYSDDDGIRVHNNRANGFHTFSNNIICSTWNGIHLEYTSQNTVTQNTISSATGWAGINLGIAGDANTVQYNKISGCRYGVNLVMSQGGPSGNIICNNEITNNERGIWWQNGPSNTIMENNIYDNTYNLYAGIAVVAENNWWGQDPPDAAKFYGLVDYDPWSTSPNPIAPPPVEVWVDDGFDSSTPGWGETHFATIQDGIDAVAGSTVHVAAGTYTAEGLVADIYKSGLTLESTDGPEVTIIQSAGEEGDGAIRIRGFDADHPATGVIIDGFTVYNTGTANSGAGIFIGAWFAGDMGHPANDNTVKNCIIGSATDQSLSPTNGVYLWNTTGNIIQSNIIYKARNEPANFGCGIMAWGGLVGQAAPSPNTQIIDNEIYDSDRFGVFIGAATQQNFDNMIVRGNTITGSSGAPGIGLWNVLGCDTIHINFNNIYDNVMGIWVADCDATVDATCNWWGHVSGPSGGVADPVTGTLANGTGDAVSKNVHFDPWLKTPYPLFAMASFVIDHAKIDFKKKPDDDKVRVKGELELGVASNGVDISEDVTVTVGSFSETIKMVEKGKKGEKWEYKRPKDGIGNIKHMTINWKNGKFDIRMDKADLSGLTDPNNVTISIQIGDDVGEETITMRVKKHHWDYKAK